MKTNFSNFGHPKKKRVLCEVKWLFLGKKLAHSHHIFFKLPYLDNRFTMLPNHSIISKLLYVVKFWLSPLVDDRKPT